MKKNNYWVVGANWGGDVKDDFYRRGYWEMGHDDKKQPNFAKLRDDIKPKDRIAIKSMDGQGKTTITIHAIGIVKEVFQKRVYIDWILKDINKTVPSKNYFGTIHSVTDEDWKNNAFCI